MEMNGSICIITNNNYCVYAKQDFPVADLETTPHAPIQALIIARKEDVEGGTAFITKFPCYVCAKALAAAGIKKVVYNRESNLKDKDMALKVFVLNGIEVVRKEIDIDEQVYGTSRQL